jgi:hypothetical protein
MLKNIGIGILVLIFLGVIFGESGTSENPAKNGSSSNSVQPDKKQVEVIEVTSIKLYREYEQNEISADNKYKGNFVKVTGIIDDIGKDILDSMYITLKGSEFIGGVQVFFEDEDNGVVATLSKNTRVTVVCKVDGLMMNVLCNDAVLVN